MSDHHSLFIPIPNRPEIEILENYRVTKAFYEELQIRQAIEHYCLWYEKAASQHQRELEQMRGDFNVLGWFYRGRGRKK